MEDKGHLKSVLRDSPEHGYELAYRLAREAVARIDDIERQCARSGTEYEASGKAVTVKYLNQIYRVTLDPVDVISPSGTGEVPLKDRILILHYLAGARGTPLSNTLITYKELPQGTDYFPTFRKRTISPLVNNFGDKPERLLEAATIFGGRRAEFGDISVTIDAFSRVPITLVLWRGDDEFPAEGNVMFDVAISDYLPVEDITILCETIAWRLVRQGTKGK
ncbi:MAG: DUF3786 domain-containing protein [Chloroflexi bacterium]|nr:DUF3786 domain-containing protein [Chloroflexota bacterium]